MQAALASTVRLVSCWPWTACVNLRARMRKLTHTPATHPPPSACHLAPPRQTVQDCTAKYGGGAVAQGPMELVDCRILRCHATALGGGLYNEMSHVTMTRVNISECSATAAGGIYTDDFAAVAALVGRAHVDSDSRGRVQSQVSR